MFLAPKEIQFAVSGWRGGRTGKEVQAWGLSLERGWPGKALQGADISSIIVDTCVGREARADQAEGFQLLSKCKGKPWKDAQ